MGLGGRLIASPIGGVWIGRILLVVVLPPIILTGRIAIIVIAAVGGIVLLGRAG